MYRISDDVIEKVLDKADIETVVGKYVSYTKRSGNNLFGLCPFHSEKSASFTVSPSKGIYHCFGCNKGGNSIGFIMEIEHLTFPEAVRFLGKEYGIDIPDSTSKDDDSRSKRRERIYNLLTDAARYYYRIFTSDAGKKAQEYALSRNLSSNTCKHFGIGYSLDSWDGLYNELRSKGYTDDEMSVSGLFTKSKNGKIIDLFRGRLMYPIFDAFGKVVAFGGRTMGDDKPKYINSPDSEVYKKQEHLYAFNFAKKEHSEQLIIVEGYMDVIAMHQAGICNVVASLGTAFTDSQLRLAAKYCSEIIFFFDADNAGKNAALRAIKMMLGYLKKLSGLKIKIKIACVPNAKDPDEYIRDFGKEAFYTVVKNAKDVDEYLFERAYEDCYSEDKLDLQKYQDLIIEFGSWLPDEINQFRMANNANIFLKAPVEILVNRMAEFDSRRIESENIQRRRSIEREQENDISLRTASVSETSSKHKESSISPDYVSELEMEVFAYAIQLKATIMDEEFVEQVDIIRPNDFFGSNMKKIVEFYLSHCRKESGVNEALLVGELQKYTLNSTQAEMLYLKAVEQIPFSIDRKRLSRDYLIRLYRMRREMLKVKREYIISRLDRLVDDSERQKMLDYLRKIDSGLDYIRSQEERL